MGAMDVSPPLLVFSDLDGTLIDHDTYRWDAAKPALTKLQHVRAGIVLASSKTAEEIITLQDALDLRQWPAIVENGAGVLQPHATLTEQHSRYDELLAVLNRSPDHLRARFSGFSDTDAVTLAEITGLSLQAAAKARNRWFSEPGLWSGSEAERGEFLSYLSQQGVTATQGGRFLTLSFGQTKADAMASIVSQYTPRYTVALGDAPNDIEMLQAADFGIIVSNPGHPALPVLQGEADGRILRTELAGPAGWNVAMLNLIERLKLASDH